MAIKDTSRKPYIQDNDTNVKIGPTIIMIEANFLEIIFPLS